MSFHIPNPTANRTGTVTSLSRTESGWPMATVQDEHGVSHWLSNEMRLQVGARVRIAFRWVGATQSEWRIDRALPAEGEFGALAGVVEETREMAARAGRITSKNVA